MKEVTKTLVEISDNKEGSDVCEFYIQSKTLAKIIGGLIENSDTDFDVEDGRFLLVENDVVHGISCSKYGELCQLESLLTELDEAIYNILNNEEDDDFEYYYCREGDGFYYEELEYNKEKIYNDIIEAKWVSVHTDLSVMDFGSNIERIDDSIFTTIMEQRAEIEKKTFNSLEEAIIDSDFRNDVTEFLYLEERDLIFATWFLYKDGKEEYHCEIKRR